MMGAREAYAGRRLDEIERDARQRELAQRVAAGLYAEALADIVRRSKQAIGRRHDSAQMGEASVVVSNRFWIAHSRTWDSMAVTRTHCTMARFEASGRYRTGD